MDDGAEPGGDAPRKRRRRLLQDGGRKLEEVLTRERPVPCRHLVQYDAERPQVAARTRGLAFEQFRRHVGDRARKPDSLFERCIGE